MSKTPVVSGKQVVKALLTLGYYIRDQKGSHIHLRHPSNIPLTVPNHKEIARGTLRAILHSANISPDRFIKLLK